RVLRGKRDATRNISLFTWVLGYFLFMGNLWVMSMRYYLPLYPPLAIFSAWLLVSMLRGAWSKRTESATPVWFPRVASATVYAFVLGFTVLWGLMFTNIYRHQATFVQAGYYTWEQIPAD